MKYCPICKVKYSDEAEFCAKCKTVLQKEDEQSPNLPVDKKRLVKAILFTVIFMLFVAGIYYLIGFLTR